MRYALTDGSQLSGQEVCSPIEEVQSAAVRLCRCARGCAVVAGRLMLPTFRARTAHIVQFRSIGAERITDSPPQLAHRSRQFTAHDTLPYP
jgi:hypothetical protein